VNHHRTLAAWRYCHELAVAVHRAAAALPPAERYELSSQLRRAATSVSANVAEGYARFGGAEFARGLSIAMGSLAEVDALLMLARDVGYLDEAAFSALDGLRDRAGAAIYSLHRGLRAREVARPVRASPSAVR
jgi:four helix bundle protein